MDTSPEAGSDRFGESFLRSKALGQRAGGGVRAGGGFAPFCLGKHTVEEPVAPAVERILDALDVAQVRADADDHRRASSISSRIRRTLASRPVKIASPTRKWPMLSSTICGIAAMGTTLSKVRPCPACGSMPFLTASAAQSAMRLSSVDRSSPLAWA